uniref:Endonuclease n=1 Tax=Hirondellea gigas TaxID=1518452 RepID=A0A2P2IDK2_9CRUS
MRSWSKSSILKNKWCQFFSVACTAGSLGYAVAKYQSSVNDHTSIKTSGIQNDGWSCQNFKDDGICSRFPSSLFPQISAATKVQDSLITRTEDLVSEPSHESPRITQIMRYGFPSLTNVRSLDDFVISYDTRTRIPHWVFEHLTAQNVAKNDTVDRSKSDFHEDGSIHDYFRSTNQDYKRSGYDRGHMAAAGNHRLNQRHCDQTFLLSNMAPQVGRGFNRDKWNELEHHCRQLTRKSRNVYVCTGPLFLPRSEDDGNLYVKYRVLGSNHVAVPTHFFKVLLIESESRDMHLESYLLPNAAIESSTPLSTFLVPVEVIERASGLLLFDKINKVKFKTVNGKSIGWF